MAVFFCCTRLLFRFSSFLYILLKDNDSQACGSLPFASSSYGALSPTMAYTKPSQFLCHTRFFSTPSFQSGGPRTQFSCLESTGIVRARAYSSLALVTFNRLRGHGKIHGSGGPLPFLFSSVSQRLFLYTSLRGAFLANLAAFALFLPLI